MVMQWRIAACLRAMADQEKTSQAYELPALTRSAVYFDLLSIHFQQAEWIESGFEPAA